MKVFAVRAPGRQRSRRIVDARLFVMCPLAAASTMNGSMVKKLISIAILTVWPACFALASTNSSGTITSAGTYQQVFAFKQTRTGCTIQKNAVAGAGHVMYVFAGAALANATHANSFQMAVAGGIYNCSTGFGAPSDAIWIDGGTSADPFYAEQW
jgi:hypothetical protein